MTRSAFAVLSILTIATFAWCAWFNVIGRVIIADGNLDTWLHHLDDRQRQGIGYAMDIVAWGLFIPLAAMNILWAIVVGRHVWRSGKS